MRIIPNMAGAGASPACPDDVRCGCGSLLARVVGGEVELKCRRCKQVWRLALPSGRAPGRWRLLEGAGR